MKSDQTSDIQTPHEAIVMNDTTEVPWVILNDTPAKAVLYVLLCLFFLYVNSVMVFALFRKPLLLESSRYILFCHLLFADSLQLLLSMLMYIFALTMVKMISYVCVTVTLLTAITVKMSPLNLAVMSLERYVAICFPLRHANIATARTTGKAIAVIWAVASLDSFVQLFLFVSLENTAFALLNFCTRNSALRLQIYITLNRTFIIMYFVLVSTIIIYTYIAIMITVKSASSSGQNTQRAHKTVLLHLLQLCLCLISTLFNMINSNSLLKLNPATAVHVQYVLFLSLIVFPKCLSPLIYGLRDQTFRHVFKYYFTFGFKATVGPFSKS